LEPGPTSGSKPRVRFPRLLNGLSSFFFLPTDCGVVYAFSAFFTPLRAASLATTSIGPVFPPRFAMSLGQNFPSTLPAQSLRPGMSVKKTFPCKTYYPTSEAPIARPLPWNLINPPACARRRIRSPRLPAEGSWTGKLIVPAPPRYLPAICPPPESPSFFVQRN